MLCKFVMYFMLVNVSCGLLPRSDKLIQKQYYDVQIFELCILPSHADVYIILINTRLNAVRYDNYFSKIVVACVLVCQFYLLVML